MSAPRTSASRALKALSASTRQGQLLQRRRLHMTGPSTFPSSLLTKKPTPPAAAPAVPTISHEFTQSPVRPQLEDHGNLAIEGARGFNSTPSMNMRYDSSTIDFMVFPADPIEDAAEPIPMVPLAPDAFYITQAPAVELEPPPAVHLPMISTASGDTNYSHFADVHDGHAGNIDFHAFAERITQGMQGISAKAAQSLENEEGQSMLKTVWEGLLDDMLGSKKVAKA